MIGGYQIISLHSTNNVLGTSYSIKGLYKKVKKTIKQIKLEDLIIDSIKMENVFINVHLDGDNYVGTFGLYQITFKSDDTYTIEENSSGSSGLYFVTSNSYTFTMSSSKVSYDNYPNLKQLYIDQPNEFILTRGLIYYAENAIYKSGYPTNMHFIKMKENVYAYNQTEIYPYNYANNMYSYMGFVYFNVYITLFEDGFIYNTSL